MIIRVVSERPVWCTTTMTAEASGVKLAKRRYSNAFKRNDISGSRGW
jgi:hypothetical protein